MINYRGDLKSYSSAVDIHDSGINWWRDRRLSMEVERSGWRRDSHQCTRGRIEGVPLERDFRSVRILPGEPKALISRNHFPALRAFAQSKVRDFRRSLYGSVRRVQRITRLTKMLRLTMVRGGIGLWITRSCSERSRPSACSNGLMCSDAFTAPGSYIIHTGRQRSEEAKRDPGGPSGFARHSAFIVLRVGCHESRGQPRTSRLHALKSSFHLTYCTHRRSNFFITVR